MLWKRIMIALLALLLVGSLSAASLGKRVHAQEQEEEAAPMQEAQTLWQVIQSHEQLSDVELLLRAAGLANNLEEDGPFTVFAPTDAAMAAFTSLAADTEATATEILLYHVANGAYRGSDLANLTTLRTLMGGHLTIAVEDGTIILNDTVAVTTLDIEAENGVLHLVEAVLLPPVNALSTPELGSSEADLVSLLTADGRFTTFLSLAETAGLSQALANPANQYTVFAPTDAAFEKLTDELMAQLQADAGTQKAILAYHLVGDTLGINQIATDSYIPTVEGRPLIVTTNENLQVFINGQTLQSFNHVASNGVFHVVDTVLIP